MEDLTGKQLGRYRIIAPLGEGGMAAVYRAYQPGMERYVALKVLPRHFAHDPEFVGRFEQEAKLIARLQHVHILPVHDYGQAEGYTYIAMPYVETGTLADLMQGEPLPLPQIRSVILQIGDALDYAHERGLIHRDVKPSNILIDDRNNCLLTDFGIAKIVEGTAKFTQTGAIIGTPAYMSPEQILGEELDGRSDIYALGIVLFEMATGRPPYRAETPPAIFVKHLNDPLPLPHTLNDRIHESLERVILKSLAKDRLDRYNTAAEMADAAAAAMQEDGEQDLVAADVRTTRAGVPPEAALSGTEREPRRKRPWLRYLGGAAALLVIAGGATLAVRGMKRTNALAPLPSVLPVSPAATSETEITIPSTPRSQTPVPAAPTLLWRFSASDIIWQLDSWGDGYAAGDLDEDGIAEIALGTQDGAVTIVQGTTGSTLWSEQVTTRSDAPVEADIFDVDRDGLPEVVTAGSGDAYSQGNAVLKVYDVKGGLKWQASVDSQAIVDFAYGDLDGDGNIEVISSAGTYPWGGGQVVVFDGSDGSRIWSTGLGPGQAQGVDVGDLDRDGVQEIAVENYDNRVFLLAGDSGKILWSQPKDYHGRDVMIADADDDGTLEVLSAVANAIALDGSGAQEWWNETGGDFISAADINADGRTEVVYSSAFDGELHVVRGETGEMLWSRSRAGIHALGDVDGDGIPDVVMASIRYYGIEPPYSVDAVGGDGKLIWSYPLDAILNESPFALALANLDEDSALEVLVANGRDLIALDP